MAGREKREAQRQSVLPLEREAETFRNRAQDIAI